MICMNHFLHTCEYKNKGSLSQSLELHIRADFLLRGCSYLLDAR